MNEKDQAFKIDIDALQEEIEKGMCDISYRNDLKLKVHRSMGSKFIDPNKEDANLKND